MAGALLPPFAEPTGPQLADDEVLRSYATGARTGFSRNFHVEGSTLLVGRATEAALWIDPATVLVRLDLPDDRAHVRADIERALVGAGLELVDEETIFAVPVALQVLGLRLSAWDLWGREPDAAFSAIRAAAAGDLDCR